MNPKSSSSFLATNFLVILLSISLISELGFCREFGVVRLKKLGGEQSLDFSNSDDVDAVARFAVEEHNKRTNSLLEFKRVIKAKEQVVAGKLYHLTLEAVDAGKKTIYEAKVWVKPWMNFKKLEEFKRVMDNPHFTTVLGFVRDGFGWRKVPVHDPEVQDAANHAVMAIQQRSNSLFPYKLLEILQAEAEVVKDIVKYNLLLKLRRGSEDEKLKVNMRKDSDGRFILSLFEKLDV